MYFELWLVHQKFPVFCLLLNESPKVCKKTQVNFFYFVMLFEVVAFFVPHGCFGFSGSPRRRTNNIDSKGHKDFGRQEKNVLLISQIDKFKNNTKRKMFFIDCSAANIACNCFTQIVV